MSKLKNISSEEQKVHPHTGKPFAVLTGQLSPELDEQVARELLGIPSVWEAADVKPTKKPKKES